MYCHTSCRFRFLLVVNQAEENNASEIIFSIKTVLIISTVFVLADWILFTLFIRTSRSFVFGENHQAFAFRT